LELGATHAVEPIEEAADLARSMTGGNGADKAVVTAGLVTNEIVTGAFYAIGKGGTLVLTGLNKFTAHNVTLPSAVMTLYKKTVKGTLFGDCNPTYDIPKLRELYRTGDLKLDELVTRTYILDRSTRAMTTC
jgi:alcohol dehydrogenase (nicotinoprotein)